MKLSALSSSLVVRVARGSGGFLEDLPTPVKIGYETERVLIELHQGLGFQKRPKGCNLLRLQPFKVATF